MDGVPGRERGGKVPKSSWVLLCSTFSLTPSLALTPSLVVCCRERGREGLQKRTSCPDGVYQVRSAGGEGGGSDGERERASGGLRWPVGRRVWVGLGGLGGCKDVVSRFCEDRIHQV
jgi:hypothetical protein